MFEWLRELAYALSSRFKSRARLEAENLVLRQQLNVLICELPKRLRLTNSDRLLLVWLYRLFPSILSVIRIVKPETVIRWHRRGFRAHWRWKSRCGVGRPPIDSSRMPRPCNRVGRCTLALRPEGLRFVLQPGSDPSIPGQPQSSGQRQPDDVYPLAAPAGRPTSSLRQGLNFR